MADFYDRLEKTKKALTTVEQEIEDNRRSLRQVEDHGDFTQHVHSQRFRLFETVSGCSRGSEVASALQDRSAHNEHFYRQGMDAVRREHERLQQHKRVLGNQYDDAQWQYRKIKAEQ